MIKNMKLLKLIIIAIVLSGCAINKPTLNDVAGSWESTGITYQVLEIDEEGKGFFGSGIGDDVYLCMITSTDFDGNTISLNLYCEDQEAKEIIATGYVSEIAIVIFKFASSEKAEELSEPLIYMKESLVQSTKDAIKSKIKEYRKQ